ncbi:hypothetical protein XIS1_760003 [Xenorhabdus innexi]|uniref:Uncharacterized protein n=1 Tax=Xenorhabdus innexi TaxID=290109 RepID=A0A1N6N0X9_9GAMM|nr:hypothetical protein XIS1_760003 [Xenorhabdus innexi]
MQSPEGVPSQTTRTLIFAIARKRSSQIARTLIGYHKVTLQR